MKRKILIVISLAISISCISFLMSSYAQQPNENIHNKSLLKSLGIDIEDNGEESKISKDEAIKIVSDKYPVLAKEAKEIKAQKSNITDKGCGPISDEAKNKNLKIEEKGYLDNTQVWIISLEGLSIPMGGGGIGEPSGDDNPGIIATEANIVIDASSGEELSMFFYR